MVNVWGQRSPGWPPGGAVGWCWMIGQLDGVGRGDGL